MKLNYKNVDLEVIVVEEKEKILVKTQNLELAKALREQGVEVLMKHTIDSFVSFYNLTLIDKKKGLVYQNLKTIGRVLKVNPFFAKVFHGFVAWFHSGSVREIEQTIQCVAPTRKSPISL